MKIEITKIIMKGFKKYFEETDFDLYNRTLISGDNTEGKSSIGEAIVWAFTGCDITGSERATRLINDKKPKVTEVILEFLLDGEKQVLIRRKKGTTNEIYWNDNKVSNSDLSKELYRNKEIFLSIVNPYFFPSLAPKDAKQLLGDILKPVKREDVYKELGDFLVKKLESNGFRTPETFLADKRADLKQHEENIIFLEGKLEGLRPSFVPTEKTFDDSVLKQLTEKLTELSKVEDNPQLRNLENQKIEIETALKFGFDGKNSLKDTSYLKKQKKEMLENYHSKKANLDNLGNNFIGCTNCGTQIDINESKKEDLKLEIAEILIKGKSLAETISKYDEENTKISKDNLYKESKWLTEKRADLHQIESEIKKIIDANREKEEKKASEIGDIKAKISQLTEEEREVFRHNSNVQAIIKQNEKLEHDVEVTKKQIENSKLKIAELKVAIDAGKQYNSIKLKKQSKMIKQYLDKVELQFETLTKDGEIKEAFKILYEGREFNYLSNAEKIKAGLEIGNFIMNMLEMYLPVFIDNSESITEVKQLNTQMILAKVVEGKKLTVEGVNSITKLIDKNSKMI